MTVKSIAHEKRKVRDVARQYEKRGYRVIVEPRRDELPNFLSGFQPDLVALKNNNNIVIEVKSKASLRKSKDMEAIAKALQEHSDWNFELIVTNPKSPSVSSDDLLTQIDINDHIQTSKKLVQEKQYAPAVLVLWAAYEGILRKAILNRSKSSDIEPANAINKRAYSLGIITKKQLNTLQKFADSRNSAAHGLKVSVDPKDMSKWVREVENLEY